MASLKVIKGPVVGQIVELREPRMILGRHATSQIVLDHQSVSRHHAQILREHGQYRVEDLRSLNGTHVNHELIPGPRELRDGDLLRICDFVFEFQAGPLTRRMRPRDLGSRSADGEQGGLSSVSNESIDLTESGRSKIARSESGRTSAKPAGRQTIPETSDEPSAGMGGEDGSSSIISTLDAATGHGIRINVRPEVKLKSILEIASALGGMLDIEDVLPAVLRALFRIFPQAEYGFFLLRNDDEAEGSPAWDHNPAERLAIRATWSRMGDQQEFVPVSMTIINKALETGQAILSADASEDGRFQRSESLASMKIRSVMCVPLMRSNTQTLGVIQLSTLDLMQPFGDEDLELLVSVSKPVTLALENAAMHEAVVRQREMDRELQFAAQVQLGFLPSSKPTLRGWSFADFYEAARKVGGDYFDYIPQPPKSGCDELAVAIADVAGKGVPAALLMARLYAATRYRVIAEANWPDVMRALNGEMSAGGLGHRFVTMLMVIIRPESGTGKVVNAGHLLPLIRRESGEVELLGLKASGMPLGLAPLETIYNELEFQLEPGEMIVIYTDGVTEAMNAEEEMFGRDRIVAMLKEREWKADEFVATLVERIEAFADDRSQRDDLCIVAMQYTPEMTDTGV
ncbi:Phosphoserine phosphatase RsbU [Planctopirus ephydatiae]|uniref:Phosphoserine phosphatase RsbU n=1 Tax=Planctopirus ephydatiae TaxID=2528019 RepID=A0A518GTS7_9PLAN|nr:SpoIIE family protein phosphatase [Planctopirus ephydatiae]QDV31996.1 Phosphoserine phosphatase RsbU [Planctopirus ephydatiae]